jgi:hypothetical protein
MKQPARLWTSALIGNLIAAAFVFFLVAVVVPIESPSSPIWSGIPGALLYTSATVSIGFPYSLIIIALAQAIKYLLGKYAALIFLLAAGSVVLAPFFGDGGLFFAIFAAAYSIPCTVVTIYLSFFRWGLPNYAIKGTSA